MHRSLALIALLCTLPLLLVSFALSLRSDVLGFMALPLWQRIINDEQSSTTSTRRTASSTSRSTSLRTYSPFTATLTYIATPTTLTRTSTTTQLRSLTPLAGPTTFTVTFTDTDTYTFNTGLVTRTSFDFSRAQYTPPLSYSLTLSCVISGRCGDLSTATLAAQKRAVATPAVTAAAVVRRATPSTQGAAALARRAYPSTQAEQVAYYTDILAKLRAQTAIFFLKTLSSLALIVSIVTFAVLYRGRDRRVQQRVQEYNGNRSVKEDAEQAINQRTRTLSTFIVVIAVFATSFFVFGLLGFILNAAFFGNGPIPPSYAAEIAFWTLSVVMLAASLVALVMDRRASAAQCQSVRYNASFDTETEVTQQQKHEEVQPAQATSMVTQMHDYNATAPIQPVSPQMMHGVYSPMQSQPQSPPQSQFPQPQLQPQAPQHNVNTVAYTNPLLGTAPAYSPT